MNSIRLIALSLSLSTVCVFASQEEGASWVSLVQLIAAPQEYLNQRVHVHGYWEAPNDRYLFLSKDHASSFDVASGVGLSETEEGKLGMSSCAPGYYFVTGTFLETDPGFYLLAHIEEIWDRRTNRQCLDE